MKNMTKSQIFENVTKDIFKTTCSIFWFLFYLEDVFAYVTNNMSL